MENGSYTEITYEQLCQIRSTDEEYKKNHRFLRLHGVLMEVTEKDYKIFYKTRRHQKYLKERSEENDDVSIDMLRYCPSCRGSKYKYGSNKTIDIYYGRLLLSKRPFLHTINERKNRMKNIKRGEIYTANLSPKIGSEQGGLRPVVILQNDIGNEYSPTTIVAAVTSKGEKAKLPTHVEINVTELKKRSYVLLEQIATIDKSRLKKRICMLDSETIERIDRVIAVSLCVNHKKEEVSYGKE